MRLALAQLNPLIGDLIGNGQRIISAVQESVQKNADLVLTPELSLWGYPPRDLLLHSSLIKQQNQVLDQLVSFLNKEAPHISILVGIAEEAPDRKIPRLFNAIALIDNTRWRVVARKQLLPTYDVFDEKRYFRPAISPSILNFKCRDNSWKVGLTICEDLWVEEELQGGQLTGPDPIERLISDNIDLLINFSASPFTNSKGKLRAQLATKASRRLKCPMIYINQVGGNDELVFDGSSFALDSNAHLALKLPSCKEALAIWDTCSSKDCFVTNSNEPLEELFNVLVLGVKDYSLKCNFKSAVLGLSGGIDSALVSVIATAALGAKNVTALLMPSPWSSANSIDDALALVKRLGVTSHIIPIHSIMRNFDDSLNEALGNVPEGITAENLQSRIRGTILMAFANQQGDLLLSTGNKSELAVGYCTLYGDMNGGLAVIGDIYKTSVFSICDWLDSPASKDCRKVLGLPPNEEIIGSAIRRKAPSAELRENQLDSDSLPDYDLLDPILKGLIEQQLNAEELIEKGHDPSLIKKIQQLLQKGEFKRHQAPPLLKVSTQAFGSGWRKPIAARSQ